VIGKKTLKIVNGLLRTRRKNSLSGNWGGGSDSRKRNRRNRETKTNGKERD